MKRPSPLLDSTLLGHREIVTSTELVRRLTARGIAPGTARQVLRRDYEEAKLWRSESLILEAGARLYARRSFYGDAAFLEKLRPLLLRERRGVARVLDALLRWEALDIDAVKKLTAVKLDDNGGGAKHLKELAAIIELGIGLFEETGTGRSRLVRRQYFGKKEGADLGVELLAQREIERQMLRMLMKHYRMQHIIAWDTPDGMREIPFNGQMFSGIGFSHLRPLVKMTDLGRKSCPVVFDVYPRPVEEFDIDSLMERIHRAGDHKQSNLRILGVVGAPSFTPAAFSAGSQAGLCLVNFGQVFGPAVLDTLAAMKELVQELKTLTGQGGDASEADQATRRFADSLVAAKNNPLVSDLCGMGLEAYAVACLRGLGYEGVASNRSVRFLKNEKETKRDVDASGNRDRIWHAVECKAYGEKVELREEDVRYFFCETLPAYLNAVGRDNIDECHAEIWTTGKVTPEIRACLARLRFDKRVRPAIKAKDEIPVPKAIRTLGRILDVIAKI